MNHQAFTRLLGNYDFVGAIAVVAALLFSELARYQQRSHGRPKRNSVAAWPLSTNGRKPSTTASRPSLMRFWDP